MEKKINIAELLKDCPSGMELNCISYDNVSFDKISADKKATYPIFCYITDEKGNRSSISFTEDGCESKRYGAKCVIFPKDKTTWEGFQRPFKDGDIVYVKTRRQIEYITIFKEIVENRFYKYACLANQYFSIDKCAVCHLVSVDIMRLATEEETEKLFQAIKDRGYKWNAETKTLEKLITPKFKVGDKIVNDGYVVEIIDMDIEGEVYGYKSKVGATGGILFIEQDEWELVPDKFDFTTLKPFDKVLVRDTKEQVWVADLFSHMINRPLGGYTFACVGHYPSQCIPYEGNEHLLGTADSCSDYYRI